MPRNHASRAALLPPASTTQLSMRAALAAGLALLAVLAACSSEEKPKVQPPPPNVVVTQVSQQDVPIYSEWVGTMNGSSNADIRPKVEGFLLKQLYTEGAYVQAGQKLFLLDPRQARASVEQATGNVERARASLEKAQHDVERYTPLAAQKAISQQELDNAISNVRAAKATLEADQAQLEQTKLSLGWTTVVSPISGIAGISPVGVGDLITPTTVMTTVSTVNPIQVSFSISEQEYLRYQQKKQASGSNAKDVAFDMILGDGTPYPHKGVALLINRQVNPTTGTIEVRAEFPNPGNVLRPGQYARVRTVTENRKGAIVVPQRAVLELQGIYQVGVVGADNKVSIRAVQVGPQVGQKWVIDSGLQPGDRVIVEGLQKVRDGMVVDPKPMDAAAAPKPAAGE